MVWIGMRRKETCDSKKREAFILASCHAEMNTCIKVVSVVVRNERVSVIVK
jgi:hypothetical protein